MKNTNRFRITNTWHRYHTAWTALLAAIVVFTLTGYAILYMENNTISALARLPIPKFTMPKIALFTSPRPGVSPYKITIITPTYTPAPTPTLIKIPGYKDLSSLSKKLVYAYKDQVYASDADGKNALKLIDTKGKTSLIDWRDDDTIYFSTLVTATSSVMIKQNLKSKGTDALFAYNGYGQHVAVSPDGAYIAYSHDDGNLSLYNVADHSSRLLLDGRGECKTTVTGEITASPELCYSYHSPKWLADGKTLIVYKSYWEGGWYMSVDPFSDQPVYHGFEEATTSASLDVNSSTYVFQGPGYSQTSLYGTNDITNPKMVDILRQVDQKYHDVTSMVRTPEGNIIYAEINDRDSVVNEYIIDTHRIKELTKLKGYINLRVRLPTGQILYTGDAEHVWSLDLLTKKSSELPIRADIIYGYIE